MKNVFWIWPAAIALSACSVGCGRAAREDAQQTVEKLNEAGKGLAEASEEISRSLEQGGRGVADAIDKLQDAVGVNPDIEPADFRELKKALPTDLDGFTAGRAIGEKTKVMGIGSSQAEIRLSRNDQGSITIRIVDAGAVAGLAAWAGRAGGAISEFDRETETGFERSAVVDGTRTYEARDEATGASAIRMFYGDRFSIELSGQNVSWEELQSARDSVKWEHLDSLKVQTQQRADAPPP